VPTVERIPVKRRLSVIVALLSCAPTGTTRRWACGCWMRCWRTSAAAWRPRKEVPADTAALLLLCFAVERSAAWCFPSHKGIVDYAVIKSACACRCIGSHGCRLTMV
jgi:hypothetical protein